MFLWMILTNEQPFLSSLTLEGVEDGKDVEGGDLHWAIGEESEAPAQSQYAAQAHDGQGVWGFRLFLGNGEDAAFPSEQEEPAHHHHEGQEGEEEDDGVVADVHYVVHSWVGDPAPVRTNISAGPLWP